MKIVLCSKFYCTKSIHYKCFQKKFARQHSTDNVSAYLCIARLLGMQTPPEIHCGTTARINFCHDQTTRDLTGRNKKVAVPLGKHGGCRRMAPISRELTLGIVAPQQELTCGTDAPEL